VTPDAAEPLSVHCPIYPVDHGTLACVPLAHGETVGAVHLYWELPDAFGLDQRAGVARVAEHAALAIGNWRLLAALQGMASTDARTGLANTRSFDQSLEDALSVRRDDESVAVLMLDLEKLQGLQRSLRAPGRRRSPADLRRDPPLLSARRRHRRPVRRRGVRGCPAGRRPGHGPGDRRAHHEPDRKHAHIAGAGDHGSGQRLDRDRGRTQPGARPSDPPATGGRGPLLGQGSRSESRRLPGRR